MSVTNIATVKSSASAPHENVGQRKVQLLIPIEGLVKKAPSGREDFVFVHQRSNESVPLGLVVPYRLLAEGDHLELEVLSPGLTLRIRGKILKRMEKDRKGTLRPVWKFLRDDGVEEVSLSLLIRNLLPYIVVGEKTKISLRIWRYDK